MAQFAGGAQRFDPYKNYKIRLWAGNRTYFGSKLTGLFPPPEVVKHRAGGDPSTSLKSPGRSKYDSVAVTRGVNQDQAFSNWASEVWNFGSSEGAQTSRKDIYLELYDEAGQLAVAYKIDGCSVSEIPALPPRGVIPHYLHPHGPRNMQEQLALIFENSLRK